MKYETPDGEPAPFSVQLTRTSRGFPLIDFMDYNGQQCSLQESSLAYPGCVWFGRDDARMHLSQEQVKALLPFLNEFAETGYMPRPPEANRENA